MDEKIKNILDRLSKSKFRSRFHLKDKDKQYIEEKGIDTIKKHADDFINNWNNFKIIINCKINIC